MKLNTFLTVKAIIALVDGIALLIIPLGYMHLCGVALDSIGILLAQLLGICLIGIGLICWTIRRGTRKTVGGILLALFITDTLAFIITLISQLSALMNTIGWVVVAIWGILALGLLYFRFLKT